MRTTDEVRALQQQRLNEGGRLYEIILPEGKGEPLFTQSWTGMVAMCREYGAGTQVVTYTKEAGGVVRANLEIDWTQTKGGT